MNQSRATTYTGHEATQSRISLPVAFRLGFLSNGRLVCGCRRPRLIATLTAALALFLGTTNCRAQADFFWTAAGDGAWQNAANWSSNGVAGVDFPGDTSVTDGAWLTNAGTYTVTCAGAGGFTQIGSNYFSNASGTVAQVTINVAADQFNPTLTVANAIVVGDKEGSTTTVSFVTSTGSVNVGGGTTIGRNGVGFLILTNVLWTGNGSSAAFSLGTGGAGRGHAIISGPNAIVHDTRQLTVGAATNGIGGNTLIVSNSATFTVGSTFRMGSSSSGGSSNNLLIVDGAQMSLGSGDSAVGKRGGIPGAYDNIMIVKNGGGVTVQNHSFGVGWADDDTGPGTNNQLIIFGSGAVTNVSLLNLRPANSINLYGGTVGGGFTNGDSGSILVEGLFRGWGSVKGSMTVTNNGLVAISNTVGALTIQRDFSVQTNGSVQVAIGSGFNTTVVTRNISPSGTLNVIDGGGLTCGTNTLFTYGNNLVLTNADGSGTTNPLMVVGSVPDAKTYTLSTNTAGQIDLIITGCVVPFRITSVARTGNDIKIGWLGLSGDNIVQVSNGGNFTTNTLSNLATITLSSAGPTNYTDVGAASSLTNRYYRIRGTQ